MTDLILSSVHRLTASDLMPFVESLERTGYWGRKIMVAYDRDDERDGYLGSCGWEVVTGHLQQDVHPAVWRFLDFRSVLRAVGTGVRYVLSVDCRDAIFQLNPSIELPSMVPPNRLLPAPEGINLEDDSWAEQNVRENFPDEWEWMKSKPSFCAGTIAGGRDAMEDYFNMIFRVSITSPAQLHNPSDQAAYNLLLNQQATSGVVAVTDPDAGFAATCGTLLVPKFADKIKCLPPLIDGPIVRTSRGRPFMIVHQYDRIPQLKDEIPRHYVRPIEQEPDKPGVYGGFPEIPEFYPNVLHDRVKGAIVAIVGPSPSVIDRGPEIDSADVVVRMNLGFPTKSEDARHVGERTDILYNCLHPDPGCGGELPLEDLAQSGVLLCSPYPRGLHPFHVDLSRFLASNREHRIPYHFIDLDYYLRICAATGTRPNTGIAAIMDLFAHDPEELRIYGFTFFQDGHRRSYKDVSPETLEMWHREQFTGNHHQEPQRQLIKELCARNSSVRPDAKLKSVLQ